MAKCTPYYPCWSGAAQVFYYPNGCTTSQPSPFTVPISSTSLYYPGPNLPYTAINTEDTLTVALQKIDALFSPAEIFAIFLAAIDNDPTLLTELCTRVGTCP